MRSRPLIPGGRTGLFVLAAAAVPIVLSRCKPFAKKLGAKMVEWGERINKEADRPDSATSEKTSSNPDVETPTKDETLDSASPAGKEEVKEQIAAETVKKKAPPKPKAGTPKKSVPKSKPGESPNPKKPTKKPE